MPRKQLLHSGDSVSASAYVCDAGVAQSSAPEQHEAWSISYVRRGSFGCQCQGRQFQLLPGSILLGRPGDEYTCTHDHHDGGDECLAFFFEPDTVDEVGGGAPHWTSEALPPVTELAVVGELAVAAMDQRRDLGFDELGLVLASRLFDLRSRRQRSTAQTYARDQRRVVDTALWVDEHSAQPLSLDDMARQAGLSPCHFLRVFGTEFGVTPHQYLVQCRLRRASRRLIEGDESVTDIALDVGFSDLSNFVRSFHRAAGAAPASFRKLAHGDRKIFQDRLGSAP